MNQISRRLTTPLFLGLVALALALPRSVEAQPGRISITVLDPGGKPLSGVSILVTTPERGDVKVKATTNPKGKATVMVPNADCGLMSTHARLAAQLSSPLYFVETAYQSRSPCPSRRSGRPSVFHGKRPTRCSCPLSPMSEPQVDSAQPSLSRSGHGR